MKVAVLGANGRAGSLIATEAIQRGLDVTAIVRKPKSIDAGEKVIVSDVYQLNHAAVAAFDVLVDALGFWGDHVTEFVPTTQHLLSILMGSKTRLLIVGGAGSLYVDQKHTQQLMDQADFPENAKPLAREMGKALEVLRAAPEAINWTYISPAANFQAEGTRTGKYQLAGEELTTNAEGKSEISYADYAIAMVDEIEKAKYPRARISVYQ